MTFTRRRYFPGAFTPPSEECDPYFSNVIALLHFEDNFLDSTGRRTWTPTGASVTTAQYKFGTKSGSFGSGVVTTPDSADFNFGAEDFTIEAWIRPVSVLGSATYGGIVCRRNTSSDFAFAFILNGDVSGAVQLLWVNAAGTLYTINGPGAPAANTWSHVAAVRNGSTCTVYLNGVGGTPVSLGTDAMIVKTMTPAIGRMSLTAGNMGNFAGHIDEVRVTRGVARYTSNFSVPTAAFHDNACPVSYPPLDWADVRSLVHFNEAFGSTSFADSKSGHMWGSVNAATVNSPLKFGNASATIYAGAIGGLTSTARTDYNIGTEDFCVEFWNYPNPSAPANAWILYCNNASGTAAQFAVGRFNTSNLHLYIGTEGATTWNVVNSLVHQNTMNIGAWNHVAVVRQGGVIATYLNGVRSTATAISRAYLGTPGWNRAIYLGSLDSYTGQDAQSTYDEFRFVIGHPVYTANFTPQTAEHPNS